MPVLIKTVVRINSLVAWWNIIYSSLKKKKSLISSHSSGKLFLSSSIKKKRGVFDWGKFSITSDTSS